MYRGAGGAGAVEVSSEGIGTDQSFAAVLGKSERSGHVLNRILSMWWYSERDLWSKERDRAGVRIQDLYQWTDTQRREISHACHSLLLPRSARPAPTNTPKGCDFCLAYIVQSV